MASIESIQAFATAKDRAGREKWRSFITGRPHHLLPFDAVREALDLPIGTHKGLQEIEVSKIVGSVGRHQEFTRTFWPKHKRTRDRWQKLDDLFSQRGFAPIIVYQVGQVYFVEDGNHRASVSRAHGIETIEAYVVKFQTDVPVYINDDLETILRRKNGATLSQVKAERRFAPKLLENVWHWLKNGFAS